MHRIYDICHEKDVEKIKQGRLIVEQIEDRKM